MAPKRQPLVDALHEPLGQRLARLRKERGLSQKDLATRLHVTQPIVSDYERERLRLHGDVIVALAKILNVSTDELLGLRPAPKQAARKDRRLAQYVSLIEQLPRRQREALLLTIRAFLSQTESSSMAA